MVENRKKGIIAADSAAALHHEKTLVSALALNASTERCTQQGLTVLHICNEAQR